MREVDAYLTRKARVVWPTAIVVKVDLPPQGDLGPRVHFMLERKGEPPIDLGGPFHAARLNLYALRNRERK